jgi:alpha-L-arabinofuranosidase
MFSVNQGDTYFDNIISMDANDSTLAASCVQDAKTGDLILKLVNVGSEAKPMKVNLAGFKKIISNAERTVLVGSPEDENTLENPDNIAPVTTAFKAGKSFEYVTEPMSLSIIRIKTK